MNKSAVRSDKDAWPHIVSGKGMRVAVISTRTSIARDTLAFKRTLTHRDDHGSVSRVENFFQHSASCIFESTRGF